jgi:hypothetical protein
MKTTLSCLSLLALALALRAADKPEDYLTKDGELKERIEVIDVQGGFAGFTGNAWTIEPSGKWTTARVFNQKRDMEKSGELTKDQLAKLAKELAAHEASSLKAIGKTTTNPHVVTVKWGKSEAAFTLAPGGALPKPGTDSVEARYAGIAKAVKDIIAEKKDSTKDK